MHLSSEVSPTHRAQVTRQQIAGQRLPRIQTQHEKARGTKPCQGKLKQNAIYLPTIGTGKPSEQTDTPVML